MVGIPEGVDSPEGRRVYQRVGMSRRQVYQGVAILEDGRGLVGIQRGAGIPEGDRVGIPEGRDGGLVYIPGDGTWDTHPLILTPSGGHHNT